MRNKSIILIIGLFSACNQKNKYNFKTTNLPSNFPKEWYMLTDTDSGYIVFNPCDAENRQFNIKKDTLFSHTGHEVDKYKIELIKDNKKGEYLFMTSNVLSIESDTQTFYFSFVDNESGIANWNYEFLGITFDYLFVSAKDKESFTVVNQPYSECWED